MARQEQDREDLLAEATALVERVSVRLKGKRDETVVGFRSDGSASFFLSAERVYQFNAAGALRRAHMEGALVKALHGTLVAMRRNRTRDAVELLSRTLNAEQAAALLEEARRSLERLREALSRREFEVLGQVPAEADVLARVREWLAEHADKLVIADSPRAG